MTSPDVEEGPGPELCDAPPGAVGRRSAKIPSSPLLPPPPPVEASVCDPVGLLSYCKQNKHTPWEPLSELCQKMACCKLACVTSLGCHDVGAKMRGRAIR